MSDTHIVPEVFTYPRRTQRPGSLHLGHRIFLAPDALTLLDGMPSPTAAATWAQLGALSTLGDLVAAADHLLRAGLATRETLRAAIGRGARGARTSARAVELARTGSESPQESRLRVELCEAGLPEPELNWTLTGADGAFIARLDLAYPQARVAVEYDGRQHALPEQFRRDADRWHAIEAEGWHLVRVLQHHFTAPETLIVARVRRALSDASRRP